MTSLSCGAIRGVVSNKARQEYVCLKVGSWKEAPLKRCPVASKVIKFHLFEASSSIFPLQSPQRKSGSQPLSANFNLVTSPFTAKRPGSHFRSSSFVATPNPSFRANSFTSSNPLRAPCSQATSAAASLGLSGAAMPSETFSLTAEQKAEFEEKGYLVLPAFASPEECAELKARMEDLVEGFDPATVSVFSTRNQTKNTNDYFLNSGGNISFFFEEKAFDDQGGLKGPKNLSINKVGHALHDIDPVFRSFSRSPKMRGLVQSLGFHTPLPVQSMYIFKQPGIGGEVVPHQDSTFLYTDPLSCVGLWLAVEEATEENGCLWALPGSHKGELSRRFVRAGEGGVTFDKETLPSYDLSTFVPLPVAQGTLVVLHGLLVHNSYENKSPKSRHAYSVHVIEGQGCEYPASNWLQRGEKDPPFEPLS